MLEKFKLMSIQEKRDELNRETIALILFINVIVEDKKTNYFNYDPNSDMSEDDYLLEEYIQVVEAKEKLVNIFR